MSHINTKKCTYESKSGADHIMRLSKSIITSDSPNVARGKMYSDSHIRMCGYTMYFSIVSKIDPYYIDLYIAFSTENF